MHHGHNHTYKSNSKPNKTATEKSFQLRQEEGTQHIQKETTHAESTTTMRTQNRPKGRLREVDSSSEIIHITTQTVVEPQRKRIESHSLFDRAIHTDEHLEHLFNVIKTMFKKKERSPTENKKKFLKRTQKHDEPIADFAMEMRDTLYHAWPGLPWNQLEDLLVDYFMNGLYNRNKCQTQNRRSNEAFESNRYCSNI